MAILVTYLPWILFLALPSFGVRVAAGAALAVSLLLLARDHRRGNIKLMDVKGALFFAVFLIATVFIPMHVVDFWAQPLGSLALLLFALGTVLAGQPFTLAYARESTDPALWDTPAFYRANLVISLAWAAGFCVMTAGAFLAAFGGAPYAAATWLSSLAGIGGALLFQATYRKRLRRRHAGSAVPANSANPQM